ncbi:RicAFT regulatory complex protein RicA family protein [Paenibacillus hodogayensis]|uniref:RicAFT regulatory complex protein RicA family protein n=1 Tax=Paenibacillus hodogayensis TaxID=279208 RepID=A0ABV5W360_9BACL
MEKFTATELIVRADIMEKAKELASLISTSDEVSFYQKAEKQVQANEEIQDLIKLIKKRQKEVVAFETFQNKKMVDKINGELTELQDKLDHYPIVSQFKQSQEDINYLLQLVVGVIRDTVSEKIQVEQAAEEEESNCSD